MRAGILGTRMRPRLTEMMGVCSVKSKKAKGADGMLCESSDSTRSCGLTGE